MKRKWLPGLCGGFLLALSCAGTRTALALDLTQRSISNTQQFIIYCPDIRLRMAVAGYVETAKAAVLETLGIRDQWKFPIVINMERPSTVDPGQPLCQVRFFNTEGGSKVEVDMAIREDQFREVHFPQQIIHAVLLELAYRDHPPGDGLSYVEPPAWLVEGLAEQLQAQATGSSPNAGLFKQLIETGRIPRIGDFLSNHVEVMDSTSRAIYGACASSLLEMLSGLPEGRASLASMVRKLGESDGVGTHLLLRHFPTLGGSEAALEKWWTLGLAHFSASDRYISYDVKETDARLAPLLSFKIVTDEKKGTKETFALGDYKRYLKFPTARPALLALVGALAELSPKTHPLLRPVVLEYQRIAGDLAHGKTRGIEKSLPAVEHYRTMVVGRMDKVVDYLNWYEATQMPERSGAFESYLKAATAAHNAQPPRRDDAMSRYLDQVEREFD